VRSLTAGQRQEVEILKALYLNAAVLILDEPTAALADEEIPPFFDTLRSLKETGRAILLVTHKLKEIRAIADRVAVMRHGKIVADEKADGMSRDRLAALMFGSAENINIERLKASAHTTDSTPLPLRPGEGSIIGYAGNYQGALKGLLTHSTGSGAGHRRTAYVPADRTGTGSAADATVLENAVLVERKRLFHKRLQRTFTESLINLYNIDAEPGQRLGTLSGGNIQKLILAREIHASEDTIVLEEPSQGLDTEAIAFAYSRIFALRLEGKTVVVASGSLDELLMLCDRIIVCGGNERRTEFASPFDRAAIGKSLVGESDAA
jgi:simple sugar transport system ATP-binding protein